MENKYQEALNHLCKYEIAYKVSCQERIDTLQELIYNYSKVEKALDKACEILEQKMHSLTGKTKKEWKEFLLKDGLL